MFNQTASSMGRFKGAVLKVRDITTAWYKHCYPFMSISQVVMPSTIAFVLPVGVVLLSGGIYDIKRGYFMYSSLYGACWLFTGND